MRGAGPGLRVSARGVAAAAAPGVLAVDLDDGRARCGRLQACGARRWPRRRVHARAARVPPARDGRAGPHGRAGRAACPTPPRRRAFAAAALTLYRSHLGPRGARYEALARAALA